MARALVNLDSTGRKARKPQHTFQMLQVPYAITPFMLAPVLPGETLKNFSFQSRAVSDPIKNPLVGWWLEYYWFYVKHRDMADSLLYQDMVLNPSFDPAVIADAAAASTYYYEANAGTNWARRCLQRVVECYFRVEGEAWDAFALGGLPVASIAGNTWLDSVQLNSVYDDADQALVVGGDDTIMASEVEAMQERYEFARVNRLIGEMSYDEFLRTYGLRIPKAELHEPELLRFDREWTYPTNTVEPTTGVPSSAVSWSVNVRADKDRFFKEPGFILGVSVARPKVYLENQKTHAASMMNTAFSWLPAIMQDDASLSYIRNASGKGPLASLAVDYWVDVRDLLMYGDQWLGQIAGPASTDKNLVPLPTAAMQKRYITVLADVQELFKTGASQYFIRSDGICSLNILGRQVDTSPAVNRI